MLMLIFIPPDFHSSSLCCVPPSQAEGPCKCNGWKSQNPPPTPPQTEQPSSAVNLQEPCRSCSHTLGASAAPSTLLFLLFFFRSNCGCIRQRLSSVHPRRPRHPPGECFRGGDEPAAGHRPGCGVSLHLRAQGGGRRHQAGLLLPLQSECPPPSASVLLTASRDALTSLSFIRSC